MKSWSSPSSSRRIGLEITRKISVAALGRDQAGRRVLSRLFPEGLDETFRRLEDGGGAEGLALLRFLAREFGHFPEGPVGETDLSLVEDQGRIGVGVQHFIEDPGAVVFPLDVAFHLVHHHPLQGVPLVQVGEHVGQHPAQFVVGQGFHQVAAHVQVQGLAQELPVFVGGKDDRLQVRIFLPECPDQFETVHPRHLQVGNDQLGPLLPEEAQGRFPLPGDQHLGEKFGQYAAHALPGLLLVVHEQHRVRSGQFQKFRCHTTPLPCNRSPHCTTECLSSAKEWHLLRMVQLFPVERQIWK